MCREGRVDEYRCVEEREDAYRFESLRRMNFCRIERMSTLLERRGRINTVL